MICFNCGEGRRALRTYEAPSSQRIQLCPACVSTFGSKFGMYVAVVEESETPPASIWPRVADPPQPRDVVAVMMTEEMARRFEERCLGKGNTRGDTYLSKPLYFEEGDLPTYIISVEM